MSLQVVKCYLMDKIFELWNQDGIMNRYLLFNKSQFSSVARFKTTFFMGIM